MVNNYKLINLYAKKIITKTNTLRDNINLQNQFNQIGGDQKLNDLYTEKIRNKIVNLTGKIKLYNNFKQFGGDDDTQYLEELNNELETKIGELMKLIDNNNTNKEKLTKELNDLRKECSQNTILNQTFLDNIKLLNEYNELFNKDIEPIAELTLTDLQKSGFYKDSNNDTLVSIDIDNKLSNSVNTVTTVNTIITELNKKIKEFNNQIIKAHNMVNKYSSTTKLSPNINKLNELEIKDVDASFDIAKQFPINKPTINDTNIENNTKLTNTINFKQLSSNTQVQSVDDTNATTLTENINTKFYDIISKDIMANYNNINILVNNIHTSITTINNRYIKNISRYSNIKKDKDIDTRTFDLTKYVKDTFQALSEELTNLSNQLTKFDVISNN